MKRPTPEWLLVPVFAVPILAALGLMLWARSDYDARTRAARSDGRSVVVRAVTQAHWLPGETARITAELSASEVTSSDWEAFRHPSGAGFVKVGGIPASTAAWELAADYPAGLRPAALADAAVRLALETGETPARQPGADAGTAAFAELCALPDEERLRAAPLPAATKLYLLRRRLDSRPLADLEALSTLCAFEELAAARGKPFAPGVFRAPGVVVLSAERGELRVYPERRVPEFGTFVLSDDGDVRVEWSPSGPDKTLGTGDVAWHGMLDSPLAGEWWLVLPHGQRWWESRSFTRWVFPAAIGCLAFLFVPAALLISLRRRRRLDEARARFVNELAHDLRTPVTSLRLHAEMLAEGRVPAGEEPRYLAVLGRETARLSSLLANLLDLSRLDRGAPKLDVQPLDVTELVASAARDLVAVHPAREPDLTVDVADGLRVAADRTALSRCLANLLENAAKFTSAGTAIRVSSERADSATVRIVVADEGPGVASADRARIFGLYERGSEAARNAAPGTGLGLALVRELVQSMGGRVSLLGTTSGAAFEIVLPEATHG